MQDLDQTDLTGVVGGTTRATNDQITQQITALQSTLKDATTSNSGGNNNTFMLLAMMMAMRPQQPTVVAAGAPAAVPVAAAPSSIVNISTRIRHHW